MAAPKARSRCRCGSSDHGRSNAFPGRGAALVCRGSACDLPSARRARRRRFRGRAARAFRGPRPVAHSPSDRRLLDDAGRRSPPPLPQRPGRARRGTRPQYRRARLVGPAFRPARDRRRQPGAADRRRRGLLHGDPRRAGGPDGPCRRHRDRHRPRGRRPTQSRSVADGACPCSGRQPSHRRPVGRHRGLRRRHDAARLVARWPRRSAAACCCR